MHGPSILPFTASGSSYVNVSLEKGLQDIPVVRLSLRNVVYSRGFFTSMFTKGSFDLYVWVVSDSKHVFLQRHLSSHCLRAVGDWVHILPLYPPVSPWTREHYHRRDIDHISQDKCTSENYIPPMMLLIKCKIWIEKSTENKPNGKARLKLIFF